MDWLKQSIMRTRGLAQGRTPTLHHLSEAMQGTFHYTIGPYSQPVLQVRAGDRIVVERDTHKAMVIGDKGERIKRIGMETRVELEKLANAKVFLELWVKVRSGWADDAARVRSFGYE